METVDDFEISKYLKTKMKNQWIDKHKKLRGMPKTGFKAHQSYASKIITSYAKRFRFRRNEAKELLKKNGEDNTADEDKKNKSFLKKGSKDEHFKIGLYEESPDALVDQETKNGELTRIKQGENIDERHMNS